MIKRAHERTCFAAARIVVLQIGQVDSVILCSRYKEYGEYRCSNDVTLPKLMFPSAFLSAVTNRRGFSMLVGESE